MWLFFCYTIQLVTIKLCTKFLNPKSSCCGEILTEKSSLEGKKNEQIKELISNMLLFFVTQYNSSLSRFVPNFRTLSQVVVEKSLTEKSSLERKKMNK